MRTITCILFALLLSRSLPAQFINEYSFAHYSTLSGLLSNQVNTVVQDAEGYIWAGTTDGLQRFDGIRYKTFRHDPNDPYSLPSNPVHQLMPDREKNMWVVLADGSVGIFDTHSFRFHKAEVRPHLSKAPLKSIGRLTLDESGNVFAFFANKEVLVWDKNTNSFASSAHIFKTLDEWDVVDLVQQPGTKKYWISTQYHGIGVYNGATGNLSYVGNNTEQEPFIEQYRKSSAFLCMFFDRQQRLWYISWTAFPNISCFDFRSQTFVVKNTEFYTVLKTYNEVHGFFQQSDGTVWVRGQGVLAHFKEDSKTFALVRNGYFNERSITYELVTALYEDREKNIWVGTDNNGLYRFNPANEYFLNIPHINRLTGQPGRGDVMSMIPTKWGTLLVGTWNDGLYHYDKNLNMIPTGIQGIDGKLGPYAWSMFASRDSNTIWVSAQPGIYAIDQAKRAAKFYNPPVLENRTVRQLVEDRHGNLWLGMQGTGVFKWTAAKGKTNFNDGVALFSPIPRQLVNKISLDAKGNIWIATPTNGIYVVDPDTDTIIMRFGLNETGERKLPEEGVSGVLRYSDSVLIITTATYILKYNSVTRTMTTIGTPLSISGFIAGMERDAQGYLWLTTTSSLYRVNVDKKIFVKFMRTDGVDNDHFILAASRVLPDGRMAFGTTNNFLVFDPERVKLKSSFPELKITDFKLRNQSLRVDSLLQVKDLELGYKDNSLVIEFSMLRFLTTHLVRYKLEGMDKDWRLADLTSQAVYSYLPPGKYRFMLKMMNEEGVESPVYIPFTIRIHAPFWKTWWFYALLLLLVSVLLFWFDRERMKRKETMQFMRSNIAGKLHNEVNQALSNINILSEMARLKAGKEPEKSKEFIEQINHKSQNMMIAMDDMLWSISPENDGMDKTVLRMKEYIEAMNNRHDVHIEVLVDEKVNMLKPDMRFRHEAFTLFRESIGGLLKAGMCEGKIHVSPERNLLLYTIQFNNRGCNMQQLANLLQSQELGKRMDAIGATMQTDIHKSASSLLIKLPVSNGG